MKPPTDARIWRTLAAVAVVLTALARPAHADGLITPFIGYDFSGDAGSCSAVESCDSKQVSYGVALGFMVGGVVGIEAEVAHAPHFFGEASDRSDNYVFTAMGNLIVGVPLGPVRPYVTGGVGLLHTDVSRSDIGLYNAFTNNSFAFNTGAGLIALFSRHVGLRGDLRYVRTFESLEFSEFGLNNAKLDFWRGSAGVVFRF